MSRRRVKVLIILIVLVTLVALPVVPAMAITYNTGDYDECYYSAASSNCSISITNNGFSLFLGITPNTPANCTVQSDQVTVSTYDPAGFTLTLGNETTTTGLVNGSYTIPVTSGTVASPAALSDTWGYHINSGAFTGTAVAENAPGVSISTISSFNYFAGPKASNLTADTIWSTSSLNPSVTVPVWYGVCLDNAINIPPGLYTTTVLYTATAN